jgi:hypothetical protein
MSIFMADPQSLPTTNSTADLAKKTVESAVNAAENAVIAAAQSSQPWIGLPIVKQLWRALLDWIFGQVGSFFGTCAGFVVIDAQQYFALKNAAQALSDLKAAQTKGDPSDISKASDSVDKAVAPILHYIGNIKH